MVAALRCCLYLVAIRSAILNHISNRFSIGHFSHSRCAFTATLIAFFTSSGSSPIFDEDILTYLYRSSRSMNFLLFKRKRPRRPSERPRVGLFQGEGGDACYFAVRGTIDIVARTLNGKRLRTALVRSLLTFGYSPATSDGKSGPTSSGGDGDGSRRMFGSPFFSYVLPSGALCSLQSVFLSVVEADIVALVSPLIGDGGGIPGAVICGDAAVM
ncbi:hypothetical protein ALC62_11524 [Cyphomyrmex costatus]|uniref:Uncharacterized protein n=1 Tax=Cyphomyrmex costatus TaxID=456900 RepID=A0A151ICE2_9HYME|nr:hypothetical protein ALC62_11524 [Cyphomyrmex costatus]